MFSGSLKVRLALLLAIVTIVSTAASYAISYALLASALRRGAAEQIRARLLEFWVLYQRRGGSNLGDAFRGEYLEGRRDFLVRVATTDGATVLLYVPPQWQGFSQTALERLGPKPGDGPVLLRSLASGRTVEVLALELDGRHYVQIGRDASDILGSLRRFRSIFLTAALPLALLAFAAGLFLAQRSLRPIAVLIRGIRSIIDTGRMSLRLEGRRRARGQGDELDQLVAIFNQMLERIEALVQGMRDALDNAAHDLRTPVTRLRNQAELAMEALGERDTRNEAARRALEECVRQSETLLRMVSTLLDIAEAERGALRLERQPVDLAGVVSDIADLYSYAAEDKGILLTVHTPARVPASVDVTRLRQALANLLDNAIKYTPAGGTVTVELTAEGTGAVVRVSDTGVGISTDDLPHIWERLYRGDRSRGEPGLGLGLSLVKAIVEAHGGSVSAASRPGAGSTFDLRFPGAGAMIVTDL